MSLYYDIDEGQPSSWHEDVNKGDAPVDTNNTQQSPVHSSGQRTSVEGDIWCTHEGVLETPSVEECVFFAIKDDFHLGTHNMLVSMQSWVYNNVNVEPQAVKEIRPRRIKIKACCHRQQADVCKSYFVQYCVSKYKRLNEEEIHVADYVFDESRDPRWVWNQKFSKHCYYNMIIMDLFPKKNLILIACV